MSKKYKKSNKDSGNTQNKNKIELDGTVIDVTHEIYKVKLDNEIIITAHVSGKIRMNMIRILAGDKVTVELSPTDLTHGIIKYRK